jgi:hypothetical protein
MQNYQFVKLKCNTNKICWKHTLCHQRMKIMKKGTPTGMMQNTADQSAAKLKRSGQVSLKSDLQASNTHRSKTAVRQQ